MNNYYREIENYIKRYEVNNLGRKINANYELVNTYWHIGKLLVDAQGGSSRAKYGNALIKKWSINLSEKYGKGYDATNLRKFRQFYMSFPNCATVSRISWSCISCVLPIKDANKKNYYINLCIKNNLSVRDLRKEIKSNSYERLINKPENIELISTPKKFNITDNLKNPILISIAKDQIISSEHDLEVIILAQLKNFFSQLGEGFTFVDNQFKIIDNGKSYYLDMLLLNYKLNAFVVIELKNRKLKYTDKAQMEFYLNLVDKHVKESYQDKTVGIIITKEQDKFIANFVGNTNIFPITYELM